MIFILLRVATKRNKKIYWQCLRKDSKNRLMLISLRNQKTVREYTWDFFRDFQGKIKWILWG
jgi:very-short-patch-repair endonuclease